MTDEELADFMIGVAQRGGKPTNSGLVRWLDWLKQEAGASVSNPDSTSINGYIQRWEDEKHDRAVPGV